MEFTKYVDVGIVMLCLAVGYVVKAWIKDVDNKYIPTIVAVIGLVAGLIGHGVTVDAVTVGIISGLASTGAHQLFKTFIDGGGR